MMRAQARLYPVKRCFADGILVPRISGRWQLRELAGNG
jgi:hypothetical protein